MKFGKVAGYNLNPDWSPYFVNYKALAKAIAAEKRYRLKGGQSSDENNLFDTLCDTEIRKVNDFYKNEVANLRKRYNRISAQSNILEPADDDEDLGLQSKSLMQYLCGLKSYEYQTISKSELLVLYKDFDSLKNFTQLNFLAVKKIFGKYDRELNTQLKKKRLERVMQLDFYEAQLSQDCLRDIEILYAENFTGGNVPKAYKYLHPRRLSYRTLFSGGLMVGLTIPLFVLWIVFFGIHLLQIEDSTRLQNIFPVYRATGLPILFLWAWGILILFWQRHGINYVYILQLNPTSIASYMDILKMASFFGIMWLISFVLFLGVENDFFKFMTGPHFPPSIFALILFLIMFVMIVQPLDVFYKQTRYGFLYSLGNIIISPFGRLYFRDFFLADILTSIPSVLADLVFTICFFASQQFLAKEGNEYTFNGQCHRWNTLYFVSTVSFLPFWWRFMQCFNKYYNTRNAFPHLVNAGKYFSSLLVVAFAVAHSLGDGIYL